MLWSSIGDLCGQESKARRGKSKYGGENIKVEFGSNGINWSSRKGELLGSLFIFGGVAAI
jgi:hypothetical protein